MTRMELKNTPLISCCSFCTSNSSRGRRMKSQQAIQSKADDAATQCVSARPQLLRVLVLQGLRCSEEAEDLSFT